MSKLQTRTVRIESDSPDEGRLVPRCHDKLGPDDRISAEERTAAILVGAETLFCLKNSFTRKQEESVHFTAFPLPMARTLGKGNPEVPLQKSQRRSSICTDDESSDDSDVIVVVIARRSNKRARTAGRRQSPSDVPAPLAMPNWSRPPEGKPLVSPILASCADSKMLKPLSTQLLQTTSNH
jgi:hypothetical protein